MTEDQFRQDHQMVNAAGESLERLPDGVSLRDVPPHIDERGCVRELLDLRWKLNSNRILYMFDRPRPAIAPTRR